MEDLSGQVNTAADEDVDFSSRDAAALDTMRDEFSIDAKGMSHGLQFLQRDAGINGSAEKHVATDSRETIQEGNTHYESDGLMPEV